MPRHVRVGPVEALDHLVVESTEEGAEAVEQRRRRAASQEPKPGEVLTPALYGGSDQAEMGYSAVDLGDVRREP